MNSLLLALVITVAMLNVVTSVLVVREKVFKGSQKRNQIVLIWLLPVVGSLLCLFVIRETNQSAKACSKSSPPTAGMPGIGSYYD